MIEKKKSVNGLNEQQFQIRAWQDCPSLFPISPTVTHGGGKGQREQAEGVGALWGQRQARPVLVAAASAPDSNRHHHGPCGVPSTEALSCGSEPPPGPAHRLLAGTPGRGGLWSHLTPSSSLTGLRGGPRGPADASPAPHAVSPASPAPRQGVGDTLSGKGRCSP